MATPSRSHADYTVAWICALPLEMAAAKTMLDEIHGPLPQPSTDQNAYTLGSLSGHNVVIACLPSGVYGTTSATTVLGHMVSTFSALRFGLMVGIGGGVPRSNNDIRLGDVVVSMPAGASGGVVQYDYGKTRQGSFERTGSLNKPPQILLTAVSQISSDSMIGETSIGGIISQTLQKSQIIQEKFSRPDTDWLFLPTCPHKGANADCSACDKTQLVQRAPRANSEPYVHYGLIASGNQVMKDAITRDAIAEELDVLCFEMEAAGLMDQLPCLVIRGICDYCDTHKNKAWQGYASLTAAAYARSLLTVVPAVRRKTTWTSERKRERNWMVPFRRNRHFVGREHEVDHLQKVILTTDSPGEVAITGLGGVGKTQVALELAYRVRDADPERSIYWVPCTSLEIIEQAYMTIAQKIGILVNTSEAKEHVKAHLSNESAGKWLLIFDNADDTDMWMNNSPAMRDFIPESELGTTLFTSRNRRLAIDLAAPHVLSLTELDEDSGVEFLRKSLIEEDLLDDNKTAILLLEQLAFLPLAITQAVAYINRNGISLSDYSKLLGDQESAMVELLSEDFEDKWRYKDLQNPVATTWWISLQQIQEFNQLAADYLSFMACINPRDIPLSLLPEPTSENERRKAIGLLKAYSFITEDKYLNLHRLVHLACRNWLRQKNHFSQQIVITADRFHNVFPHSDHKNQSLWREYLPHALSLLGESDFQGMKEDYVTLLRDIADCLHADGRYYEAEELQLQVVDICQAKLGPDNAMTLSSMVNLTTTYRYQGRWKETEAIESQVLKKCHEVLGPDHLTTIGSMINLAVTYRYLGRWKESEDLGIKAVETCKQALGLENLATLMAIEILVSTYSSQGRWEEAEKLGTQVVDTRTRIQGTRHPNTLTAMAWLGYIKRSLGNWDEASKLEELVMYGYHEVLGPAHPLSVTSLANMASVFSNQGRWEDAEAMELQILETRKHMLGPEHPDTLTTKANLAATYHYQGRVAEAEELEIQVLESCTRVFGPEHPETLSNMDKLAHTMRKHEKFQEAKALLEECVKLRKKVLGPDHPDTKTSSAALFDWREGEDFERLSLQLEHTESSDQYHDNLSADAWSSSSSTHHYGPRQPPQPAPDPFKGKKRRFFRRILNR